MKIASLAGVLFLLAAVAFAADRPASPVEPEPDAEGFFPLFNGKDLDGWKANMNPEYFKAENGEIIARGGPSHLFYVGPVRNHDFKNFHFIAEVKTRPKANSGIYFHTADKGEEWPTQGFEAQVNQTHRDKRKTGGLYAIKDVMRKSPVKDDEWYKYEILVEGNKITLKVNDEVTTEWEQPKDWQAPTDNPGRKIGSGTFALQAHDPDSETHYRNIRVKPLP